ncbi:MAG: helicase-related protein [Candidatus Heimdallarchaeota archaeon]
MSSSLLSVLMTNFSVLDEQTIAVIHADMEPLQRKKVLDELQKEELNNIRIVISSSVLELGVNISNIQTVINIGVPITQKDGIVQRMARNRSKPGERRMNLFIFDLENPRDKFYWEHKEILREILETNACNPILYPKRNGKVFVGILLLLIRYGITDFQEIMNFFRREGLLAHEFARQQYTRLVTESILKKKSGKLMFTSKGEENLFEKKELVPFSIRAIDRGWAIKQMLGYDVNDQRELSKQIGRMTTRDVLRKGLPRNLVIRNKHKYLVQDIDHQTRSIYVKKSFSDVIDVFEASLVNILYEPSIIMGVLPKVAQGPEIFAVNFGQLTIEQKPKVIADHSPERTIKKDNIKGVSYSYSWKELTEEEAQDFSVREKTEGIILNLFVDSVNGERTSNKELLNLLGKMLLIETEVVLGIPSSEIGLINNNKQLALFDKGKGKGNTNYLFKHFKKILEGLRKRLTECSCVVGCKNCYSEIIGEFPKGAKEELVVFSFSD